MTAFVLGVISCSHASTDGKKPFSALSCILTGLRPNCSNAMLHNDIEHESQPA